MRVHRTTVQILVNFGVSELKMARIFLFCLILAYFFCDILTYHSGLEGRFRWVVSVPLAGRRLQGFVH